MPLLHEVLTIAAWGARFVLLSVTLAGVAWRSSLCLLALDVPYARLVARKGFWGSSWTELRARRIARTATGQGFFWILVDFLVPRLILAAFTSAAAGFGAYWIWNVLQTVADGGPLEHPLTQTWVVLLIGYLVYILGPLGIIRAFRRITQRKPTSVGWPPMFPAVDSWIDPESHLSAAKALYKFHLYLVMVAIAASTMVLVSWGPYIRAAQRGDDTGSAFRIGLLGTTAIFTYWWITRRLIRSRARRLHALDRLALAVQREQMGDKKPVFDAAGRHRKELQTVLTATDRYAWYLQKRAVTGVRHPIAHLLRLSGAHVRVPLSTQSVLVTVPDEIAETMRRMTVLTAGTSNTEFLDETSQRLTRFADQIDNDPSPGHAPRFTAGIDLTDKTTILASRLILIALAVWLLVSRQLTVADFVQLVP